MNFFKYILYIPLLFKFNKMNLSDNDIKHIMDFISNPNIQGKFIIRINCKKNNTNKYYHILHKLALIELYLNILKLHDAEQKELFKLFKKYGIDVNECTSTKWYFIKRDPLTSWIK